MYIYIPPIPPFPQPNATEASDNPLLNYCLVDPATRVHSYPETLVDWSTFVEGADGNMAADPIHRDRCRNPGEKRDYLSEDLLPGRQGSPE